MRSLDSHLDDYLRLRRGFGYDLAFNERVLRKFTAFADDAGIDHVSTELFLRWKDNYGSADNNTWSKRLTMVRGFARWLQGNDPLHEVPPSGLVPGKFRRSRPYIYTDGQVAAIVTEAGRLTSSYGVRGRTYSTLLGLIAATGLRINEAIGLNESDVDLEAAVLTARCGKNGKSRFVPVTPCTRDRLETYRRECTRLLGPTPAPFFRQEDGRRPTDCSTRYAFAQVCQRIGLRTPQRFNKHGTGPRIHDLRHTFAVHTIMDWYRRGFDVDREMHKLSTYFGHIGPESTYWYMEAVPELLQLAADRAVLSVPGDRS